MKTDARIRYTRMVIRQSFLSLLKEKPLNQITVKEICERSEINRATFYHHYKDPFDLLDQIEEGMLEGLQKRLSEENFRDIEAFYVRILESMKENGDWYITVYSAHSNNEFAVRIFLACYRQVFPGMVSHFSQLDPTSQKLLYHFLAQGCSGVMSYWFKSGMKESTEVMARFLKEASEGVTEHFSGNP